METKNTLKTSNKDELCQNFRQLEKKYRKLDPESPEFSIPWKIADDYLNERNGSQLRWQKDQSDLICAIRSFVYTHALWRLEKRHNQECVNTLFNMLPFDGEEVEIGYQTYLSMSLKKALKLHADEDIIIQKLLEEDNWKKWPEFLLQESLSPQDLIILAKNMGIKGQLFLKKRVDCILKKRVHCILKKNV